MPFKRTLRLFLLATSALALTQVQAHTLDLGISNDAFSVDYNNQIPKSELNVGAGTLHNTEQGDTYYGSLFVADNVNQSSGILAGLGVRAYYIDSEETDSDGKALGLGGFLNWDIPSVPHLSLRGDLYYAPDVLTFDDIEEFIDFSGRVQYRVIEQAWIYAGYRRIKLETELGADTNIEEGGFAGMMFWF